jgi:succinate dehydrogenase / fumarate reductase iron-sulfur subunit
MNSVFLKVSRFAPGGASEQVQSFRVAIQERMTVLDGLFAIQREQDPSLCFRYSCRVAMCGTCAMYINRIPRLACKTGIENLASETITVEPLPHLPVLKDLIVSLEPFFAQWKRIRPAFHFSGWNSQELARIPPSSEFGRQAREKRDCITCAACFSACGVTGTNRRYLGPAAINKAYLRLMDPRDGAVEERLRVVNDELGGIWRCHTQFNCVAACPKGIDLTDSIARMKRAMLRPGRFREKLSATSGPEV